ncbi:MAG: hypothetical protein A2Z03_05615 [Chloroflexi bacterium RBG_16_56_8]|nr:MAG: hypothetical protein A2Z03_05615 [Chloroflexi bacterium RBG_16_56_8]
MAGVFTLPSDYWTSLRITPQDIEYLHTYLFERETPLTLSDLASAFVEFRIGLERAAAEKQQKTAGRAFLPREKYQPGDELIFPVFEWKPGKVTAVREGVNPSVGAFDVIAVTMEDGSQHMFAASLPLHPLNEAPAPAPESNECSPEFILHAHGAEIVKKLEMAFQADTGLVRIAGRWFPRSLLVDVNVGHLNLAEAALDVAAGDPQPTSNLLKDVALPEGVNPKLAEFSLNLALQEDDRFDEVGPAGEVLWSLRRLEPDYVRNVPAWLQYLSVEHERAVLNTEMLALEAQLDDELSPIEAAELAGEASSIIISLIYPHLRSGTLPVSARARKLFPTAYESPRVRFILVDGRTRQKMPAWVVLQHGYVYGLREWYKAHQLMPGSLVQIRRGERPGEVIVEAKTQRAAKDWVRTLIVGADGGMVFAMLKQPITAEFNDRMAIYVPDFKALDPLWEKKKPFGDLVTSVMHEMTKLNPQGHVHAQELYAAVNLVRRVPPAPLFALLESKPTFKHVGDLHYRLVEETE